MPKATRVVHGSLVCALIAALFAAACSATPNKRESSEPLRTDIAAVIGVTPLPAESALALDDPPTLSILAPGSLASIPRFDGSRYFATWLDPHSRAIMGLFIPESGPITAQPIALGAPPLPRVDVQRIESAAGAAGVIVAWTARDGSFGTSRGILGTRVLANGTQVPFAVPDAVDQYQTVGGNYSIGAPYWMAADSAGFSMFYYASSLKGGLDLVHRRFNGSAAAGSPTVLAEGLSESLDAGTNVSMYSASNGESVFVAWQGSDGRGAPYAYDRYFTVSIAAPALVTMRRYDVSASWNFREVSATVGGFRAVLQNPNAVVASFDSTGAVSKAGTEVPFGFNNAYFSSVVRTNDPETFVATVYDNNTHENCLQKLSSAGLVGTCEVVTFPIDRTTDQYPFGFHGLVYGKSSLLEVHPGKDYWTPSGRVSRYAQSALSAPESLSFAVAAVDEEAPSLASDGGGYLIAWRDTRASVGGIEAPAIFAQRLGETGAPIAGAVKLSSVRIGDAAPIAHFDGTRYVVAWTEQESEGSRTHIVATTLPSTGTLVPEAKIDLGDVLSDESKMSVNDQFTMSSDGVNLTFVWTAVTGETLGLFGARVSIATNTLIDTTPVLLTRGIGYNFPVAPHIVFAGKRSLLVWLNSSYLTSGIAASFIEPGKMELVGAPLALIDTGAFVVSVRAVASEDDTYFVIAQQYASEAGGMGLRGAYLSKDGKILGFNSSGKWIEGDPSATIPIAFGSGSAEDVAVAYAKDKANFVAAWSSENNGERNVHGAWIDPRSGFPRDPDGVPFAARTDVLENRPTLAMRRDGKGMVAYQEFVSTAGAFRIRLRAVDSGSVIGSACASSSECGTRECIDGVCCESACAGGCGVCNVVPGTCTPKTKGAACGATSVYVCDGATSNCPVACVSDEQCVSRQCVNGQCETPVMRCVDDFHLRDEVGTITDCGIYKCNANACRNPCRDIADCKAGLVCNFDGACVDPPVPDGTGSGCGEQQQSVAGNRGVGANGGVIAGFASAVLFVFRRRAQRTKGGGR